MKPGGVLVKPGDRLITSCGYNTIKDSEAVVGGIGTMNEMCFNFIEYYPEVTGYIYCQSGQFSGKFASGIVIYQLI